jgi:hypothetical protein
MLCLLVPFSYGQVQKEDFRKGIRQHEDWVNRLLETYDPRILYLLQSRCGYVTNLEHCSEICEHFKNRQAAFKDFLIKQKISDAFEGLYEEKLSYWKERYPKNYIAKSKYYYVMGEASQKKYLIHIAKFMDKVYSLYSKKFQSEEKIAERFFVIVYPNEKDFKKTLDQSSGFAFAYFSAAKRELVCHLSSPNSLNQVLRTLAHEGFHQFLGYYVPNPPIWLNEGLAEYFEGMDPTKKLVDNRNTINESALLRIKTYLRQGVTFPLKRFIYMTQKEYYYNPSLNYAQGWSVIYFLAYASKSYNKYYNNLIQHLKNGKDREEALNLSFENVDFEKFERAWKAYILAM